jgi:transcriptional regulator with XRE-family HTH domain
MTIGEKIRFLRVKQNLSQEDLAKVLNTTKQAIYKYENGIVTNIPTDKIEILSNILGTTPSYLMGWEDETPAPELTESERTWIELYRKLSPDVQETFVTMVKTFDSLPEGERQMLLAMIRGALGSQAK